MNNNLPVIDQPIYNTTLPISKRKVAYRPYLVKEEKIMLIALKSDNFDDIKQAIKQIISNCTNQLINPNDLTYIDILFLLSKVRGAARGDVVPVTMHCRHLMENGNICNTPNDVALDLSKMTLTHDHDPKKDIMPLTDSLNLKLEIPGLDMLEILNEDAPDVTQLASTMIDSVFDNQDEVWKKKNYKQKDWEDFIENTLNVIQLEEIREYVESLPKTKIDVDFVCTNCSHNETVQVQDIQDFLD